MNQRNFIIVFWYLLYLLLHVSELLFRFVDLLARQFEYVKFFEFQVWVNQKVFKIHNSLKFWRILLCMNCIGDQK